MIIDVMFVVDDIMLINCYSSNRGDTPAEFIELGAQCVICVYFIYHYHHYSACTISA